MLDTRFHWHANDSVTVERVQDVEAIVEWNKHLQGEPQKHGDLRHKWNLPNVMVERFYNDYCGNGCPPMDKNFWEWVDKKMNDPQYRDFRTDNKSNPFFLGYRK